MNPDIVEVVARAMFYAGDKYNGLLWDDPENSEARRDAFREDAQAALTAARPAILEEAAGIAEEYGQCDWFEVGKVVKQASRDIATAIRAAGERP